MVRLPNNEEVERTRRVLEDRFKERADNFFIVSYDGTHSVGKDYYVQRTANFLEGRGFDVSVLRETDDKIEDSAARSYASLRRNYIDDALRRAQELTSRGTEVTRASINFDPDHLASLFGLTRKNYWEKMVHEPTRPHTGSDKKKQALVLNRSIDSSLAIGTIEAPDRPLYETLNLACPTEVLPADLAFVLVGHEDILYQILAERARETQRQFQGRKDWIEAPYILEYALEFGRIEKSKETMRRWWLQETNETFRRTAQAIPNSIVLDITRPRNDHHERIGKKRIWEEIRSHLRA